jgi:hypothetical protein
MAVLLERHERDGASLGVVEPGEILDLETTPRAPRELAVLEHKAKSALANRDLFSLEDRLPLVIRPGFVGGSGLPDAGWLGGDTERFSGRVACSGGGVTAFSF